MAISGQENINIGLPNESANSDSLYDAFSKTQNNFGRLFQWASPFSTFNAGVGIGTSSNSSTGTVSITNTGVTSIIAGSNVSIDNTSGVVTISASGGGGGGGSHNSGTDSGIGRAGGSGIVIISYPGAQIGTGGANVFYTGSNTVHTFTTSGTFTA